MTGRATGEALGRAVRDIWLAWARTLSNPRPSWLLAWEELPETERVIDRRIGATLYAMGWEGRDRALSGAVAEVVGLLGYFLGLDPDLPPLEPLTLESSRALLADAHGRLQVALDAREAGRQQEPEGGDTR
jgi:hypothetical protein